MSRDQLIEFVISRFFVTTNVGNEKNDLKKPEIHVSISLWRIFITLVSGEVGFNCTYLEICG